MTRPRRPARPRLRPIAVASAAALLALPLAGCYTRTVKASGIGSDRIETEEPYAENWPFEPLEPRSAPPRPLTHPPVHPAPRSVTRRPNAPDALPFPPRPDGSENPAPADPTASRRAAAGPDTPAPGFGR